MAITINLDEIVPHPAKIKEMDLYLELVKKQVPSGADVILTGKQPVWIYLAVAHLLHGLACRLSYQSPVTGQLLIFDHNPF